MALARLITRAPEYTHSLVQSLESAGYTVECVGPEETFSTSADLEVNLDDPSAASSYLVTADGREISFTYDPVEREFILAPLWRKLRGTFAPLMERLQRKPEVALPVGAAASHHEATFDIKPPEPAVVVVEARHDAPVAPVEQEDLTPTTVMPAVPLDVQPVAQSLYLPDRFPMEVPPEPVPEPPLFTSVEYFDGQGVRRNANRVDREMPAPQEPVPQVESRISETSQPTSEPLPAPAPPAAVSAPWLVRAALKADALRSALHATIKTRVNDLAARRGLSAHDASWMRAAPVAAILVLTFLLGWALADTQRASSPKPAADQTSSIAPAAASAAPVAVPRPRPVKLAPAPVAKRTHLRAVHHGDEDDSYAADVVVRHYPKHYPSKGVRAAKEPAVKRFSDLN